MTLDELTSELPPPDDEFHDGRTVVDAFRRALAENPPPHLAEVSGDWRDPYLELRLVHSDGTALNVVHGDGLTKIEGGPIDFQYYLATQDLITVLCAALAGTLVYFRHRPGLSSGSFSVDGTPGWLGLGHAGRLVHRIQTAARLPHRSARITFRSTPCLLSDR